MDFIRNGGSLINRLIAQKISENRNEIRLSGNYEIEETILLPSDVTLILDNCYLKMADNTFCQMFRNMSAEKADIYDSNIHIIGVGESVLDGGEYNGLSERNSGRDGRPYIIVNNILTFSKVKKLSVSGLKIINMRWWALNFIACSDGYIHDIDFASDATAIDRETGERLYGFAGRGYDEIYIKNSDGIDLRLGCHDFLIENITGFTEDDTVALTALKSRIESYYPFPADAEDGISSVTVRNIRAAAQCGIVRLLNQGGTFLHDITVDGVYDTSQNDDRLDRGDRGVKIGDRHLYGEYYPTAEETYNITVKNVEARAKVALSVCGEIKNLLIENINGFDGCEAVIEKLSCGSD